MPETRIERFIFGVGALAIAALVALIVLEMTDRFGTHQTHAATRRAATPAVTNTAENTTASVAETTAPEPPRNPSGITLRLKANADTWVEIRAGSAHGVVLYSGILPQGNAKRFRTMKAWASFGAASNLTARLNGNPLQLPPGTYTALISTSGLRPLG